MVRLNQVLLAVSFGLFCFALSSGCLGCGPGSTEGSVDDEANVASNNGTSGQVIGDPNTKPVGNIDDHSEGLTDETPVVIDGKICEGNTVEVLYDANGNPAVCADATTVCEGMALFNKNGKQVCEYEPPPIDTPVEHTEQCTALTPGDGQWFDETSDELMEVGCQPIDDSACAVSPTGEGSLFNEVTFIGTEFPLSKEDGIYTMEMDLVGPNRLVQRTYVNGKLAGEAFFRR